MSPQVSVILPVRGAAPHLRTALRSLAWQDLRAHEVLLIDDQMDAPTRTVARAAARRDSRLRVIPSAGAGLVAALNTGLVSATAPLLARMDGDDICHPHRLSLQRARLEQGDVGIVGCLVRSFPRPRITPRWRAYESWLNGLVSPAQHRRDLWVESPLCHPSVMLQRSLLESLGGYREGPFPEDYDLWLRCAAAGHDLAKVAKPLLLWRDSDGRLTRVDPRYRRERFHHLKASHLRTAFLLDQRGLVVWGAGEEGKALGRAFVEVGCKPLYYVDIDPRKVGNRVSGVAVVDPAARPWRRAPAPMVVVAVGSQGVRETVRSGVAACGLTEGVDFVMAA